MKKTIVQNNPFFNELQRFGREIYFTKENNPINYQNSNKYFYIILSGRIKCFNMNMETSREQTLYLLEKGDMFDILVLLDGKEHDIMTEVLTDGIAIEIHINKVKEWMKTNPDFQSYLMPYIAKQFKLMEDLSSDLSLLSTSERLTNLIIKDIQNSRNLLKELSNTEIANLIGTVRQVVERHLKKNQIIKK